MKTPAETPPGRKDRNDMLFFAPAPLNMEDLMEKEISACGGQAERIHRTGIHFSGSLEAAYRLCLWSRIASRILLPLWTFEAGGPGELYERAAALPWDEHMNRDASFAVDAASRGEVFKDARYAALKVKDAAADYFREREGARPAVDTRSPDLLFNLNIRDREVTISLDLSGDSLHKRGYRLEAGPAPLKENAAAAVLLRAGWPLPEADPQGSLLDPMCGSGTLLIEGALMAGDIAPGLLRQAAGEDTAGPAWGFEKWKGHDPALWTRLLEEARKRRTAGLKRIPPIRGQDKDPRVIKTAARNIHRAGLSGYVRVEQGDLETFEPGDRPPGLVVSNPPYGKRLEEERQLAPLYRRLGEILKDRFPGWRAAVLSGSEALAREIGIKPDRVNILYNGSLKCELSHYRIFSRQERRDLSEREKPLSPGAEMFANRLKKNLRLRRKWARKTGVTSYRLYDADMPEYAAAVDYYEDTWVHMQEYAPPEDRVDPQKARQHRREILAAVPTVLPVEEKNIFFKTREKQKGSRQYGKLDDQGEKLIIREGGLKFLVNFRDYLDTGIFLDHRITRARLRDEAGGRRFLNLFCYTGTASVYAAAGGAVSTDSVDTSRAYLEWAAENFRLNRLDGPEHRFIQEDVPAFLKTTRDSWDLIFLDPPTFSNSKSRDTVFDIQKDHPELLRLALARLAPGGLLYFSNNYRKFRLDETALAGRQCRDITAETIPEDFARGRPIHRCWLIR